MPLSNSNLTNGLSINKINRITLTNHALERAAERLGIQNNAHATGFFREKLRDATRVGETLSRDGNESILYANDGVGMHLSPDLEKVITVCIYNPLLYDPIKDKVKFLYDKELRKISRAERAKMRRMNYIKAELQIELAELNLRSLRTRSQAVRDSCQARTNAIQYHLQELEREVKLIQNSKRQLSKVLSTLV